MRESIHLVNVAGKTPVDEFNRNVINSFDQLFTDIEEETVKTLERVNITANGVDMEKEGLRAPTSTWTYLINDSPEQLGIMSITRSPLAVAVNWPAILGMSIWNRFFRFKKVEEEEE
jgi:preprotein translocase subunit SecA